MLRGLPSRRLLLGPRAVVGLLVLAAQGWAQLPVQHPQVLQQCSTEPQALQVLKAGWDEDLSEGASADVLFLVDKGWWAAVNELLRLVRAQSPGTDLEPARRHLTSLRDSTSSALMHFRVNTAEDTTLAPAFQWAQSTSDVFLNVKFSSRMDGPSTVLSVVDEKVTITEDSLSFNAVGRDKPKRIRLQLRFGGLLDPNASSWSFAAVGRVSFSLRKAEPGVWPRLLSAASARPKNMHAWYERQEDLDKEIEREQAAAELRRRVEAIAAGGGAAAAGGGRADDDDDDDDADVAAIRAENAARRARAAAASARAAQASAAAALGGGEAQARAKKEAKPPPGRPTSAGGRRAARRPASPEPPADVRQLNSSQLLGWLEASGLGRYRRAFERHKLDGAALAETSEEELRAELRMDVVGDRKRLRLAVCAAHPRCTVRPNAVHGWAVADVQDWLVASGLGAHARRFRAHKVDGVALLELSDEELKDELRMGSVRDRKLFRVRQCEASSECELLPTEIAEWSEPQVADWLRAHGYDRQRARFARRAIDGLALLELSEADLRDELGVWELGLRKRFGRSLCAADRRVCPAVEGQPDQYTDPETR